MRTHAAAARWQPALPHAIGVTSRDARDVESVANVEFVDALLLRHAVGVGGGGGGGARALTAVARVLGEHDANETASAEWMYALAAAQESASGSSALAVRNRAFMLLERRDVSACRELMDANPSVPRAGIDEIITTITSA